MSDFFQNGSITTIHNLSHRSTQSIEEELQEWSRIRPMALVLPCLYSELEGPALSRIVQELSSAQYISQIIIGLDRANERQFRHAQEYFSQLPQEHRILWNDGPRMSELSRSLAQYGLAPNQHGKGRNVWNCFGYFLASGSCEVLALHDCDILDYNRALVARLFYPMANPSFTFSFSKGYYYRASAHKLNGRVTRLLVTPLIRALKSIVPQSAYLEYLDSFRYPLAGEFSLHRELVYLLRIPSDWGLEISVLSEVFREFSPRRVCQIDIADAYDHKHQPVSGQNASGGLSRMSTDIAKAIFRNLAADGVVFTPEVFHTLRASYYREALDFVERYHCDATANAIPLDRHREESTVETFLSSIIRAGNEFLNNPSATPFMASWARVKSALPGIYDELLRIVELDRSGQPLTLVTHNQNTTIEP